MEMVKWKVVCATYITLVKPLRHRVNETFQAQASPSRQVTSVLLPHTSNQPITNQFPHRLTVSALTSSSEILDHWAVEVRLKSENRQLSASVPLTLYGTVSAFVPFTITIDCPLAGATTRAEAKSDA